MGRKEERRERKKGVCVCLRERERKSEECILQQKQSIRAFDNR